MPGDILAAISGQPLLLAAMLFAATFVLEDAATIAAGLLVARSGADPTLALSAVILGTAAGDMALYAIGRWGAGTKPGRKLRARADVQRAEQWIAGRVLTLVFAARFMPGSRLPVYTASGLVAAPLGAVATMIGITTPVWTGALFMIARLAGEANAQRFITVSLTAGLLIAACVAIRSFARRALKI